MSVRFRRSISVNSATSSRNVESPAASVARNKRVTFMMTRSISHYGELALMNNTCTFTKGVESLIIGEVKIFK